MYPELGVTRTPHPTVSIGVPGLSRRFMSDPIRAWSGYQTLDFVRLAPSRHRPRRPQLPDRRLVVAGLAQHFIAVLADAGRTPRRDFLAAVDPDRAVDGEHGVALERHQHFVLEHLLVIRNVVEDADHAEHQAVAVEYLAPFGEVSCGEYLVEDLDQFQRPRVTVGPGGEPDIGDEILASDAAGKCRPLPVFAKQRQHDPAAVPALVVIGHRVQRALAGTPLAKFRTA